VKSKTFLVTCGETSGEHHASRVACELKRREPDCRIVALGGDELESAGAEILFPLSEYAVMGFAEIVTHLPKMIGLERKLASLLGSGAIDCFIPVDYPGLNLRLARRAKKAGVPVCYFVSPQVWAWGGWRIRAMRKSIDVMAVILPFEEEVYRKAGIPAVFVGHPLLDEIPRPVAAKEAPGPDDAFTVMLFPGSRRQEVERILPTMTAASRLLRKQFPKARFTIGLAPLIDDTMIDIPPGLGDCVHITRSGLAELSSAALVLAASGTVTLLSAMSGTPLVVVYRTSAVTYGIGRMLVTIPWIAMPNVLARRMLVPEFVQGKATPRRIADAAQRLLGDPDGYRDLSNELIGLREILGGGGGAARVAEIACRMAEGASVSEIIDGAVPPSGNGSRGNASAT
jgi:lipid-A-disaccharide synthase